MAPFDWNAFWAQATPSAPWLTEGAREQVRDAVGDGWLTPGMTVLDLGCGIGNSAAWLAERGFHVVGVDVSSTAIERARTEHRGVPRLEFDVADVAGTDTIGRQFDAILDCGCLHALDDGARAGYAGNLRAWSRGGTRLLLLMRYGTPLFGRETDETRVALIRSLLVPPFDVVGMSPTNMAGPDTKDVRPGLVSRLIRRDVIPARKAFDETRLT